MWRKVDVMTTVVNLYKESYDIYIGRRGKGQDGYFGNPFTIQANEARGSTIEKYRQWFYARLENDCEFRERIENLRGKILGCFCVDKNGNGECHGKIIAEYLDNLDR